MNLLWLYVLRTTPNPRESQEIISRHIWLVPQILRAVLSHLLIFSLALVASLECLKFLSLIPSLVSKVSYTLEFWMNDHRGPDDPDCVYVCHSQQILPFQIMLKLIMDWLIVLITSLPMHSIGLAISESVSFVFRIK